jgi:PST family polysaccharide transporter
MVGNPARRGEVAQAGGRAEAQPPILMDARRILHGLFWASSSFVLGKLLVFASIVVLARLLAPQAFGAMALAMAAILVLEIFGTMGLTSALIFEEADVDAAARICFWITVTTSVIETIVGWYGAPVLARFFNQPDLAPMLRALSLSLVIMALGNTHDTLLRRKLSFRRKLLPDLGMAAMKGGAGVVLAFLGWGVWSLIWGQVLACAVGTLLLWWVMPWRPGWPGHWDRRVARRMFGYAGHIYLIDTSSVLLTNFDTLTIGRMLSETWLGFYTLAFRIPEVLLLSVLNVVTRVVFPAFSRLQNERATLRDTVMETVRYTTLLTVPIAAGMAVLARPIILGVYGWHWGPSVPVLEILALYAGIRCLTHHFGDAYKAIGRPDVLTKTTIAWWVLLPPDLILGAHWGGIVGVAWGQVVTRVAMTLLHVYLIARYLKVMPKDLWRCFAPCVEATGAMCGVLLLVRDRLAVWGPRPELALTVPLGIAVYMAALAWRYPDVLRSAWGQVRTGWRRPQPSGGATPATVPLPVSAAMSALEPRA